MKKDISTNTLKALTVTKNNLKKLLILIKRSILIKFIINK